MRYYIFALAYTLPLPYCWCNAIEPFVLLLVDAIMQSYYFLPCHLLLMLHCHIGRYYNNNKREDIGDTQEILI